MNRLLITGKALRRYLEGVIAGFGCDFKAAFGVGFDLMGGVCCFQADISFGDGGACGVC